MYVINSGVFSGNGVLSYANGDRMEGSFYGNYTDGMKFNGTIYKTVRGSPKASRGLQSHHSVMVRDDDDLTSSNNSIGQYSVPSELK